MNIAIIIPAYHPDGKLTALLETLTDARLRDILLIDDGSGESCRNLFEEIRTRFPGVTILEHECNQGKGAALKTAFAHLQAHRPEIRAAVTADSDGQHTAQDIRSVMDVMQENSRALILGARSFDREVPWRSSFGNRLTRFLMRIFFGIRLQDTQTGLRGIPAELFPELLGIPYNRYEFELEMLILAARGKYRILEVPIHTIYLDNNASSHFRPFVDSAKIYSVLFRNLFSSRRKP